MNVWIFNSILPLCNKDVKIIGNYNGLSDKIECQCKKCGTLFYSTPSNLLNGKLHTSKFLSKCNISYSNKLNYSSDNAKSLISKLADLWKQYSDEYIFLDNYIDIHTPIRLQNKKTHKIYSYYLNKSKNKILDDNTFSSKQTKIKVKKVFEYQKVYEFYDKQTNESFYGTVSEFLRHIHKTRNYKYLREIQNLNWFKKRFKIIKTNSRIALDDNSTYIRYKCNRRKECSRTIITTGKSLCEECRLETQNKYYSKEEFNSIAQSINYPKIEILSEFQNRNTPISCRCRDCGYVFTIMPIKLLDTIRCAKCNSSKGEQIIQNYLDKNNIVYEKEKQFEGLFYFKPLRFDFYLPLYNVVIEFDGLQHFQPVLFYTSDIRVAKKQYKLQQIRDNLKNDYCKNNHIGMLRIKYDEVNIEKRIADFLNCRTNK